MAFLLMSALQRAPRGPVTVNVDRASTAKHTPRQEQAIAPTLVEAFSIEIEKCRLFAYK
jgi:hypothetical protein